MDERIKEGYRKVYSELFQIILTTRHRVYPRVSYHDRFSHISADSQPYA